MQGHEHEITCLKLLNNDTILISGDKCGNIRLWDVYESCTIKVFQPWGDTTDTNSIFRISNIVQVSNLNDKESSLLQQPLPFQRFPKGNKEDDVLTIPPSSTTPTKRKNTNYKNTAQYHKLLKQCQEFYEQPPKKDTTIVVQDDEKMDQDEIKALKDELQDAKSVIERWEKVNTKLMIKLNKFVKEEKK